MLGVRDTDFAPDGQLAELDAWIEAPELFNGDAMVANQTGKTLIRLNFNSVLGGWGRTQRS